MRFKRVNMFKENEEKNYCGEKKKVYDYDHPEEAVAKKQTFFIFGIIIFILSLFSYGLDVLFKAGRNIYPYGYTLISIPFIIISLILLISIYKYKNITGNYPLDKISKWHVKGCPLTLLIGGGILSILLILRLLILVLILKNNQTAINSSSLLLSIIQTIIILTADVLMFAIIIGNYRMNKEELKIKEKPIEECNYIVHDLIRDYSPYSWFIVIGLLIMMFVVTILI